MRGIGNCGFTLVELLVTVGLMAVITAGVITLIGPGPRQTARDARRQADLEKIASALELFRNDQGSYPEEDTWSTDLTDGNFISSVPTDPQTGGDYVYTPAPADCTVSGTRCVRYSLCADREKVAGINDYCIPNP